MQLVRAALENHIETSKGAAADLRERMMDVRNEQKESAGHIQKSLGKLHARWWSMVVWLISALGAGFLSLLIYIWTKFVNP